MITIYKGTLYEVPILSPTKLDGARLYNLATRTTINMDLKYESNIDGNYSYKAEIVASNTAKMPQGIYNLELYAGQAGSEVIASYYENYAKVTESSFTQQYA